VTKVAIYLALGSNLGDRMGNLTSAVERLSQKMTIKKVSSVYETEPVYYEEQPLYFNAVLSAVTELEPFALLRFVKSIESDLGRQHSFRNAPRLIDIDILFYGDLVVQTEELTIPHPGIVERAFVLAPLAEIAPELIHPVIHEKVEDLLAMVNGLGGVRKMGKLSLKTRNRQ
jgi:2-amino-4-hydroxy-6-hydroxymethyldihydropteridine diphosphokinase